MVVHELKIDLGTHPTIEDTKEDRKLCAEDML